MLAILLVHLAGSGQLSGEIANKKPLASLMANSLGTVMLIDAYNPFQGEGGCETDSLAAKPYGSFLEEGDFLCRESVEPTSGAIFKVLRRR